MKLLINKNTFSVIDLTKGNCIAGHPDEWIEIPDEATTATQSPDKQIIFWKGDYLFWDKISKTWDDSRNYANVVGHNSYYSYWKHKYIWAADFHTYEAVPEDPKNPDGPMVAKKVHAGGWDLAAVPDTVYHYAASYNSPRGTVNYDGVVSFPGRVTGIDDYHKIRAQIAEDGHVTAERVNVHSLTVIG